MSAPTAVPKHGAGGSAPADRYDLVVIGAGQGGGPLAGAFARAGRRVALIERRHVGGTCINDGCSPTKTIIASARAVHMATRAGQYGVRGCDHLSDGPRVDLARVRHRKQSIVERFRVGSERALAHSGVELVRGEARFIASHTIEVTPSSGHDAEAGAGAARLLTAGTIVINTGLRPAIPPLPGLDRVPYLTSSSIMELSEVPEQLIVLGGGYVGLEFAQAFQRFGSRVTIVQRDRQLLPREDEDIADAVLRILQDEGTVALLSADAVGVTRHRGGVRLLWRAQTREGAEHRAEGAANGEQAVSGSHLMIATGRAPNTDSLALSTAGVDVDTRGYIRVNDRLETSVPGVYAIGDVNGGPAFTHVSYDDFRVLRTNLLEGGSASTVNRLVPYTVFLDPQLGAIGMTEREARASGRQIRVGTLPMTSVARALEVDETRGFMKAIIDAETSQILGARVLGLEGGEIATLFQIAMMSGLPYTALRDGVFSHPTIAESLNNLFMAMDRNR